MKNFCFVRSMADYFSIDIIMEVGCGNVVFEVIFEAAGSIAIVEKSSNQVRIDYLCKLLG